MVLLVAILLLVVVPASLLYLGRFIVANTDKRAYAAMQAREAALSPRVTERAPGEEPWYARPMLPAFQKPGSTEQS